jgi:alpha-galactosidase
MSKDQSEGVLFAFRTYLPHPAAQPMLYLRGLIPDARYKIEGFDQVRSGQAWMEAGLQIPLDNLESAVRRIKRV